MLKGNRCACVFVFPYICLAKGNLIVPVTGFGFACLSVFCPAVQCGGTQATDTWVVQTRQPLLTIVTSYVARASA